MKKNLKLEKEFELEIERKNNLNQTIEQLNEEIFRLKQEFKEHFQSTSATNDEIIQLKSQIDAEIRNSKTLEENVKKLSEENTKLKVSCEKKSKLYFFIKRRQNKAERGI